MSSDNPIGNIFNKFLNKGASKSVSDYLIDIAGSNAAVPGGPLASMHTFDKYGVFGNINDHRVSFHDLDIEDLGKSLTKNKNLYIGPPTRNRPGVDLGELFGNINRRFKLGFGYNPGKDQLFMLSETGSQFALPLQNMAYGIDSSLVSIGGIRRGAYKAIDYGSGNEATYTQLFYQNLAKITAQSRSQKDFLRRFKRINSTSLGIGASGKNVSLGSLLTSTTGIRGSSALGIEAKMFGTRARVVGLPSEVLENFQRFREARYVINTVSKHGNIYKKKLGRKDITWLGENDSGSVSLRKAWDVYDEFMSSALPNILERLGVTGYHHMVKPENLIGDKGLIVPSRLGISMYEAAANARQAGKGIFGMYHESVITKSQQKLLMKARGDFLPTFMYEGELIGKGLNNITRRSMRIAVVSEKNLAAELGLFGDSSALLTSLGKETLAGRKYLGGFKIANPLESGSKRTLSAVELLTGRLPTMGQELENVSLGFSRKEMIDAIDAANWVKTGDKETDKYFRNLFKNMPERQKALVTLIRRSGKAKGLFDYLVQKNTPFTMSTKITSGGLKIDFNTSTNVVSNVVEALLPGGIRFTGAGVAGSHQQAKILEELSNKYGVEAVMSEGLYNKVEENTRYISNFLGYMKDAGREEEAIRAIGYATPFDKHGDMNINVVTNSFEAANAAKKVVAQLRVSKSKADRRLARNITKGQIVARAGTAFGEFSSKAVRMATIDVSVRSDTALDINPLKSHRFTPGKMKTLAWNSKLMGYSDPNSDPVFSMLSSRWKGLRLKASNMDLDMLPDNNIYQYIKNLHTPGVPAYEDTIRFVNGQTFLGDRKLKNLPNLKSFSMGAGGIGAEDLEGTILGNEFRGRLLHVDLGSKRKLASFLENESRYLPLPVMMARVGQTSGRYVVGKSHSFHPYMKVLDRLQSGANVTLGSLHKSIHSVLQKMMGKEGIMAKMNTIHNPASVAIRLAPPTFNSTSNLFNVSEMYNMKVSRKAFSEEMIRKWELDKSQMEKMLDIAKSRDFTYVMMGADPAQRGEHIGSIFKLYFTDEAISGTDNVLYPQMHEFIKKLYERDNDRDRMNMILLEAMDEGKIGAHHYENRIAQQQKLLNPSVAFLKSTFLKAKVKGREVLSDIFGTYLGQKTTASLGYSIARPSDRLMSIIMNEGAEGLKKLGINLNTSTESSLNEVMKMFSGNPELQGAAMSLNQFMFQAGVKKDLQGKNSLRELTMALTDVSEQAKSLGYLDLQAVQGRLREPIENLVRDADMQRFWHSAPSALMESKNGRKALERLQAGLAKGAATEMAVNAAEHTALIDNVVKLMSLNVGVGAAIKPFTRGMGSVGELFEGQENDRAYSTDFMKKVAGSLMGIVTPRKSSGVIQSLGETSAKAAGMKTVESIRSVEAGLKESIASMAHSKYLGPAMLAIAGAGVYGYMNRPDLDANLPPPVDDSMPADRSPAMPDYQNSTYINTSPNIPRVPKMTRRLDYSNMNNNYFNPSTNSRLRIEDARSPYNPWLIRQQMNKVSDSEFTY